MTSQRILVVVSLLAVVAVAAVAAVAAASAAEEEASLQGYHGRRYPSTERKDTDASYDERTGSDSYGSNDELEPEDSPEHSYKHKHVRKYERAYDDKHEHQHEHGDGDSYEGTLREDTYESNGATGEYKGAHEGKHERKYGGHEYERAYGDKHAHKHEEGDSYEDKQHEEDTYEQEHEGAYNEDRHERKYGGHKHEPESYGDEPLDNPEHGYEHTPRIPPYVNVTFPSNGCKAGTIQEVRRLAQYDWAATQTTWCSDTRTLVVVGSESTSTVNPFTFPRSEPLIQIGGACYFNDCPPGGNQYNDNHLNHVSWTNGPDTGSTTSAGQAHTTCTVANANAAGVTSGCTLYTVAVCCEPADPVVVQIPVTFPSNDDN